MRNNNNPMVYPYVALSFAVAFCFMIIPISQNLKWFRPDLVTLVLIYWVATLPNHVGIVFAFMIGLLFDLLTGMLFGSMGLTLGIVAFLTMNLRLRLRIYRFWQKFIVIMLLVACSQLIRLWIQLLIGHPPASFLYWFSSISSALAWPVVYTLLQSYQRTFKLA
jgi:rod shape-determining protein MreD